MLSDIFSTIDRLIWSWFECRLLSPSLALTVYEYAYVELFHAYIVSPFTYWCLTRDFIACVRATETSNHLIFVLFTMACQRKNFFFSSHRRNFNFLMNIFRDLFVLFFLFEKYKKWNKFVIEIQLSIGLMENVCLDALRTGAFLSVPLFQILIWSTFWSNNTFNKFKLCKLKAILWVDIK